MHGDDIVGAGVWGYKEWGTARGGGGGGEDENPKNENAGTLRDCRKLEK